MIIAFFVLLLLGILLFAYMHGKRQHLRVEIEDPIPLRFTIKWDLVKTLITVNVMNTSTLKTYQNMKYAVLATEIIDSIITVR